MEWIALRRKSLKDGTKKCNEGLLLSFIVLINHFFASLPSPIHPCSDEHCCRSSEPLYLCPKREAVC